MCLFPVWVNCPNSSVPGGAVKNLYPTSLCHCATAAPAVTMCSLQLRFYPSDMGKDEDPKQTSLPAACTCSGLWDCVDLTQPSADAMGGDAVPVWKWSLAPGVQHLHMVPPFLVCGRGCYHTYLSVDREQKDVCWFLS